MELRDRVDPLDEPRRRHLGVGEARAMEPHELRVATDVFADQELPLVVHGGRS